MELNFEKLIWDSEFFNMKIGRVNGDLENENDIKKIESLLADNEVDLSYFSTQKEISQLISSSKRYEFKLVDKKTTYFREMYSENELSADLSSYSSKTSNSKLDNLAIQSGVFSRFNVDKKIEKQKFEELYKLWISKSLTREIAKEVLVYKMENEIVGFVTLAIKGDDAFIGIIAVDDTKRGNGIGANLMKGAENWFYKNNFDLLRVVTQGDNFSACKFYEKCGYSIEQKEFFYHIWKK
ncbi:MAG: GNAT family N-acetyltransferase [Flavobacteriales bacterium]|nr:GNAT family N-acetyltransferase [Flavobacteriales bacterium]